MIKDEPVAFVEAVKLLFVAVLTGGHQLSWWTVTDDQQSALIGIYVAASLVVSLIVRSFVTPNSKIAPEVVTGE